MLVGMVLGPTLLFLIMQCTWYWKRLDALIRVIVTVIMIRFSYFGKSPSFEQIVFYKIRNSYYAMTDIYRQTKKSCLNTIFLESEDKNIGKKKLVKSILEVSLSSIEIQLLY